MTNKIRIKLKSYDHKLIDLAAIQIVEIAKSANSKVSGPVPLPTKKEVFTVLRAVHKFKKSREQFEMRTYSRLIDLSFNKNLSEKLKNIKLPNGVDINVRI